MCSVRAKSDKFLLFQPNHGVLKMSLAEFDNSAEVSRLGCVNVKETVASDILSFLC